MRIQLTPRAHNPEDTTRALELLDAAFVVDKKTCESRRGRIYMDVRLREPEITPVMACHVLHHFGEGGYAPGSFVGDLIALVARADPENRRRLALGHPAYVLAVGLAQVPGGVDELRAIACGDRPPGGA